MASAAGASATILTSPAGTVYTEMVRADLEGHLTFQGSFEYTCKQSVIAANTEQHGPSVPTEGKIIGLSFAECGSSHFLISTAGTFKTHTDFPETANGNGIVTWTGGEITVQTTTIFGTFHCIYATQNTVLGTINGSKSTGGTATLEVNMTLPRAGGSALCGSATKVKGNYKITTPDYLDVD